MTKKDEAAELVLKRAFDFQMALSNKRKYPVAEFKLFANAVRQYADLIRNDRLIDKKVVHEINGLTDYLRLERKRVPDGVLAEADRLECLVFAGYDPYFEGDEPPGL